MSGQLMSLLLLGLLARVSSRSLQSNVSGTTRSVEYKDEGDVPPHPKHDGSHMLKKLNRTRIKQLNRTGSPNMDQNVWELSGLREGDIMDLEPDSTDFIGPRNVMRYGQRWEGGVVPYSIDGYFGDNQRWTIRGAMGEIERNTCVRFRPYRYWDRDYVVITASSSGCWSYVGRESGGQTLNLSIRDWCVDHGTAVHELLHVLGLHHQQSASNRDDYVQIHWENIRYGEWHNFEKLSSSYVTDYGLPYDYGSIMHYSSHVFSWNGGPTITPLRWGVEIGQDVGMSSIDIKKINILYGCNNGWDYWDSGHH